MKRIFNIVTVLMAVTMLLSACGAPATAAPAVAPADTQAPAASPATAAPADTQCARRCTGSSPANSLSSICRWAVPRVMPPHWPAQRRGSRGQGVWIKLVEQYSGWIPRR